MKREIKITLFALSTAMLCVVNAQSLSDFKAELALFDEDQNAEFARYVNVEVHETESAQQALEALIEQSIDERSGEPAKISKQGYRIGIFFDNGPSARAKAVEVKALCDSLLSDIPATMSYANPYFKVSAGYCISQEEAVITLHRVQRYFPAAYLMREEITPADMVLVHEAEIAKRAKLEAAAESAEN